MLQSNLSQGKRWLIVQRGHGGWRRKGSHCVCHDGHIGHPGDCSFSWAVWMITKSKWKWARCEEVERVMWVFGFMLLGSKEWRDVGGFKRRQIFKIYCVLKRIPRKFGKYRKVFFKRKIQLEYQRQSLWTFYTFLQVFFGCFCPIVSVVDFVYWSLFFLLYFFFKLFFGMEEAWILL